MTYLFHPTHRHKILWDLFMGVLIIFSIVTIPFRIGFEIVTSTAMNNMDYFLDAFFLLDMIVSFNTASIDPVTNKLITNRRHLMIEYAKFWFWIDFVSSVPVDDIIAAIVDTSTQLNSVRLIRIARLVRLVKLARFVKLGRLKKHVEDWISNPAVLNVMFLLMQIFFVAHLICCFWYFITTSGVTGVDQSGAGANITYVTWANHLDVQNSPVVDQYVISFYWTLATMLAIGYGDVTAMNGGERVYSILTMLCGGIMFGAMIGQVTRLIESRNPHAKLQKIKMTEMKSFLLEKRIPVKLKSRAKV